MKISYIAPVNVPIISSTISQGIIEKAIQNAIVIPFKTACIKGWIILVDVGGLVTLFIAMGGLIAYIGGNKKGKNVAITCGTLNLILQLLNYFILG